MGGVGSVGARVAWVKFWRGLKVWRRWRGSKKGVSSVGRNFDVGRVSLRCFIKKVLLKVSQNLQE